MATDGECNWLSCTFSERTHDRVCRTYQKEMDGQRTPADVLGVPTESNAVTANLFGRHTLSLPGIA